jgi:hypothetical protein
MRSLGPGGIFTSLRALKQNSGMSYVNCYYFLSILVYKTTNVRIYIPVSKERQGSISEETILEILLVFLETQLLQHASCTRVVCIFSLWL